MDTATELRKISGIGDVGIEDGGFNFGEFLHSEKSREEVEAKVLEATKTNGEDYFLCRFKILQIGNWKSCYVYKNGESVYTEFGPYRSNEKDYRKFYSQLEKKQNVTPKTVKVYNFRDVVYELFCFNS